MEKSVSEPVKEKLLFEMKEGAYRYSDRLPRESELAERLGISRTQLRDDLAELEREGFITRRHGVGTMINRHVLEVKVRADLEEEFMGMVSKSGFEPTERLIEWRIEEAGRKAASKLLLRENEQVLFVSRAVYATGAPAIYCEDIIPMALIREKTYADADFQAPIFDFLKRFCRVEPYMDLTDISIAEATESAARALSVKAKTPLLYMDEVDYDIDGRPVLYAPQYFARGIIEHTVMRKKF